MASSVIPGVLDPTKPREYPIVLSDALLGKMANETFTGVKYNHKPKLSSATAPNNARIKPASDGSYDLSFQDKGGKYAYNGSRSTNDGQFVLVFDPKRKVLVLHRVDSMFDMNLTLSPSSIEPDSLGREQTEPNTTSTQIERKKAGTKADTKPKGSSVLKNARETKKKPPKGAAPVDLPLPPPLASVPEAPKQQEKKKKQQAESDHDSDSEDDGTNALDIVWGDPDPAQHTQSSSAPAFAPPMRRFSEFYEERQQEGEEEENDAGDEYDLLAAMEEDEEDEARPGPAKSPDPTGGSHGGDDTAMGNTDYMEPDIDDLEAELEAEFAAESESEVSEED